MREGCDKGARMGLMCRGVIKERGPALIKRWLGGR